jgi:BASS family bile acid:Na+ symporter
MSFATLILLALQASLMLLVFSVGLSATAAQAAYVLRRPRHLARSIFAMNVCMPAWTVLLAHAFPLAPAVRIALVALSVSPVPPFLPSKALHAGGGQEYTIGLLVSACLVAFISVPLALALARVAGDVTSTVPPLSIVRQVLLGILAPLLLGIGARRLAPAFAERVRRPLAASANLLLIIALIPVFIKAWGPMRSLVGNGTLAAFCLFVLSGLCVGHWLGGPAPGERSVLAMATASRHPGIALALARATFPEQTLVTPAVFVYLLVSVLLSSVYGRWMKRRVERAALTQHGSVRDRSWPRARSS